MRRLLGISTRSPNRPADLNAYLAQVEQFATGDYQQALLKGDALPDAERKRIAEQLSAYTGLTVPYLLKTNLRIEYGAFQKEFLAEQGLTTGTLDTRFLGATLDPLSKVASDDPQGAALGAAYVAAYHNYVPDRLNYRAGHPVQVGHPDLSASGTTSISRRAPTSRSSCSPTCFPISPPR